ncbi:MAG: Clp protease N-terminal domain-containing protein [Candidatus Kapaibacterium sp.]|jgi:ATP-dependent Clp protease ATP-binding subunit ClpA
MEKPTESFQLAVKDSWKFAKDLNSNAITSAHILLAILQQDESNITKIMNRLVADITEFQNSVSDAAQSSGTKAKLKSKSIFSRKVPQNSLELTDEAETIIANAMKVSANRNESATITHIIRGMLENSDSVAFSVLSNHLDIAHLKRELL